MSGETPSQGFCCFFSRGGFLTMGALVAILFLLPIFGSMAGAGNWSPVPCRIIRSGLLRVGPRHRYTVNLSYSYSVNGHEYHANRYDFMGGGSGDDSDKAKIVALHPSDSIATCHVNPKRPAEAVLERGFTSRMRPVLVAALLVPLGAFGWILFGTNPLPPMPPTTG